MDEEEQGKSVTGGEYKTTTTTTKTVGEGEGKGEEGGEERDARRRYNE